MVLLRNRRQGSRRLANFVVVVVVVVVAVVVAVVVVVVVVEWTFDGVSWAMLGLRLR